MAKPFPFEPLPLGQTCPQSERGTAQERLSRDLQIVRWFVEKWTGKPIELTSPLGRLVFHADSADFSAPTLPLESMPEPERKYWLYAASQISRLAWAIRALHGRSKVEAVHGSFVAHELLAPDTKEKDATYTLAGGVGTLLLAGRLAQAGGERICVHGNRRAGHDIRLRTGAGDGILVERKDRAFEAGLDDTMEGRARRVVQFTGDAGAKIPRESGAVRVLALGFHDLVRGDDVERVGALYSSALRDGFADKTEEQLAELPDYVIVEHFGLEPRTGGEKTDFHAFFPLRREGSAPRVESLLDAALGRLPNGP